MTVTDQALATLAETLGVVTSDVVETLGLALDNGTVTVDDVIGYVVNGIHVGAALQRFNGGVTA